MKLQVPSSVEEGRLVVAPSLFIIIIVVIIIIAPCLFFPTFYAQSSKVNKYTSSKQPLP